MKRYRLVKPEPKERDVFGEPAVEVPAGESGLLVLRGEFSPSDLEAFMDQWEALCAVEKQPPVLVVPSDATLDYYVWEQIDDEGNEVCEE